MTNPKHTDTSSSGDLIYDLRNSKSIGPITQRAAADRIEALEAENERFEQAMGQRMMSYLNQIEALEAENERLREALHVRENGHVDLLTGGEACASGGQAG